MSTSQLALAVLLLPAAGAILLAGRGWRLPRIVTVIVGPGVVWASFAGHACPLLRQCQRRLHLLDVDQERLVRGAVQPAGRQPLDLHVPGHHRRGRADRHVLRRLHGARGRPELRALFHLHGRVHLLDAAARPGRELRLPDRRLGDGRPELVPPDRLLVPAPLRRARRAQGVRDERDRRRRHDPRRVRPVRDLPRDHVRRRLRGAGG